MESTAILQGIHLNIDGVSLRATTEALSIIPEVPDLIDYAEGCWYDDGLTRKRIDSNSEISIDVAPDAVLPEYPHATHEILRDITRELDIAHANRNIFVIGIHEGDLYYAHEADHQGF